MGWLSAPLRLLRNLPIAAKLASTTLGALLLLTGVSLFAVDRLAYVAARQEKAATQSAIEHQVQQALLAAGELRVASRDLQSQQTVTDVRAALNRAEEPWHRAMTRMQAVNAGPDQPLLDDSMVKLNALMDVVRHMAALRIELLTVRQKQVFQVRPVFDQAMDTLMTEIDNGPEAQFGAAPRQPNAAKDDLDDHDATVGSVNRYRLAMSRLQASAMMFMATGAASAANDVKDAMSEAGAAMSEIQSGLASDTVKHDAQLADSIGGGLAVASIDLIRRTRDLDKLVANEVETASQAMREAFEKLAETAANRQKAETSAALTASSDARTAIRAMIGAITLLMVSLGGGVIWTLSSPVRRLSRIVQAIASGDTDTPVPFTDWRDEVGSMAASVEKLRKVMRRTFIQAQIIEQLPVGVMTADASRDFRIAYINPEVRQILEDVKDQIGVPVDNLVGSGIDTFHRGAGRHRQLVADPANLPHRTRIVLGSETIDVRISAMFDRKGGYAGPLLIWRRATAQAQLVRHFEDSVGGIARDVSSSATSMRDAASAMRQSTIAAGERTVTVAAASQQASASVNTAAVAAEEVAVSVAEIARQVAESAQIAATAVSEAQATDASVSSLNEAADRISAVVRLISDIAARTNLLALNATIEAARAGDAGKGFAVVAGEVKNLANQTAKATEEIGGQIAAMQQATGQAVTALRSISATIQRMNDIATLIAGSVEEQGAATQSIAQAVGHAASGTAEVNSNIATVSSVVAETGSRAGSVLDAATALTEQASTLKTEVARFLVAVQHAA